MSIRPRFLSPLLWKCAICGNDLSNDLKCSGKVYINGKERVGAVFCPGCFVASDVPKEPWLTIPDPED